ncbi:MULTISPECIES: tetratricopeptide repeat protein [unclassified Mesorhizobium]|uniref:adenylate/guanylate cyclase domain-containing protein n=1 Tax=unclassified Mesorhizobium TaxID=325217 RepID=UPI000FD48B15|nr:MULTISPECIES: tetratricopeptide repeat protein [unclassified Mesorhizobium]RVB77447.1 tetratricopeptide repeat protein [Mesorhizobium sp. M6A.T.Cr.TU.014.01.1.1]RWP71492.1 MAG: tetratricopeptide repeat protein [Mesorhizobium sp.]RWQ01931.1 MAG: tetratricopeptide repeat protein [Mesorhizobium sp.]RWQ03072.1 MAG: tetratricopeptide repeat protein [Mesorhizobium sp.]
MDRRLTAILAADVVGYSRLMGEDEVGTLEGLKSCRRELINPEIKKHHGRMIKLMGDGALVEFASVVDAVQCAAVIQRRMADRNKGTAEARQIRFRIGVNLGDIIVEGDDIYGDGVNIAARLQAIAEPGGICISGTAFDHAVHKVDVGFADIGGQRLKNIADPVRAYRVLLDPGDAGKILAAPRRPGSRIMVLAGVAALLIVLLAGIFAWQWQKPSALEKPSIAVLPFTNLSGDPGQDYFADGITEDLITDLAKLSGLDVIARNSVFAYKGKPLVLADVGRDLGVQFVVDGSVRRTGDQIRLNAQLIDIATGNNLWANRFDRGIADVFAVQDEMGREIAKALGVQASAAESERMARPPTSNLEAYDNYLRAEQAARSGGGSGLRKALALYEKAEEIDTAFAEAFAADARTSVYVWRAGFDDITQSALARKRAYEKAGKALELDPDLSSPYALLGIMQVIDRHYDEAIASAKRAVAIGPGDAGSHIALGYVQLFAGNHAEAANAVETALKLDPNLPPMDREIAGLVFLLHGDTAKAIETLERTRDDAPADGGFRILLAAAYARAGRLQDAKAAIAEGLRVTSTSESPARRRSLAAWRHFYANLRNAEDLALILDAMRQAGLPEWPFNFTADEQNRLNGAEIASLVLGHTLQGQLEPDRQPAIMQVAQDGTAGFRTMTRMLTLRVYVDHDVLCEQSENSFGRPECGPVYKRSDVPGEEYSYVNSGKVFHFVTVN